MNAPQATVFDLVDGSLERHGEYIGTILFLHLVMQQVLYEYLIFAWGRAGCTVVPYDRLSFFQKTNACAELTIPIDGTEQTILWPALKDAILRFNRLRNLTAHQSGLCLAMTKSMRSFATLRQQESTLQMISRLARRSPRGSAMIRWVCCRRP